MPWELTIHTIDVGQGESSLIVARNVNLGTGVVSQSRAMLIDGGLLDAAPIVHDYVSRKLRQLNVPRLDFILATHDDKDHLGGLVGLLLSDAVHALADFVVQAAVDLATLDLPGPAYDLKTRAAIAGLGACAATWGLYRGLDAFGSTTFWDALKTMRANLLTAKQAQITGAASNDAAANIGRAFADNAVAYIQGINKLPLSATTKNKLAKEVGATLANVPVPAVAPPAGLAVAAAKVVLKGLMPASSVDTEGLYRTARIYALDDSQGAVSTDKQLKEKFSMLARGTIPGNYNIAVPGLARARVEPALGTELLWRGSQVPDVYAAGAPTASVVAVKSSALGKVAFHTNQGDNDVSIGLAVRHNEFCFYTGGDLPMEAEAPIARSVLGVPGVPADPANNVAPVAPVAPVALSVSVPRTGNPDLVVAIPAPDRIAAFKCGHHGAASSTGAAFLQRARPVTAVISCGGNGFGNTTDDHPTQQAINRLGGFDDTAIPRVANPAIPAVQKFFLTNSIPRLGNPAKVDVSQDPAAALGVISGANIDDGQVRASRGHLVLTVPAATSSTANGRREINVTFRKYLPSGGPGRPAIILNNNQQIAF